MKINFMIYRILLALCVLVGMQACQEGYGLMEGGQSKLELSFCASGFEKLHIGTKSVTEKVDEGNTDGYEVKDFWVFEYDDVGKLIGAPRYYLASDYQDGQPILVSVFFPSDGGIKYKLVVIANTHNPDILPLISYTTLAELKSSSIPVRASEDMYQQSEGVNDLLMNGVVDISNQSSVTCVLYRNIAKLNLKISNAKDSGVTISSLQLKSMPDRLFLADQLYVADQVSPDISSVGFWNMSSETLVLTENLETDKLETEWLTYYIPRNMRGTNSSTTEAGKNINAPDSATYLEIKGVRTDTKTPISYKFYLGKNNINDFNVEPNHLYTVQLSFTKFGDENDNRIEDMSVVLLEESNSYLINASDAKVKYTVPVENRINTYWTSNSGKKNPDYENYLIGPHKEWVAEILWQDVEGEPLIQFCDDEGQFTSTYRGRRDDKYFSFVTTAAKDVSGNVVIGVRRADSEGWTASDGYMWSWHIWVTDYNPYEDVGDWQDGKYEYDVPGGKLHRYSSMDDIPMYKNKYMMDRNYGAKASLYEDGYVKCSGVFYQYGRKDPFPPADDVVALKKQSGAGVMIYQAVNNPLTYYTSDKYWNVESEYNSYTWSDLKKEVKNGEGKSFFDPCPPGWRLPTYRVWTHFGTLKEAYASNSPSPSWTGNPSAGWCLYLTGSQKTGHTAYFPAAGMRNRNNGSYASYGSSGSMWQAEVSYFYYSNTTNLMLDPYRGLSSEYRAMGIPVRCISE